MRGSTNGHSPANIARARAFGALTRETFDLLVIGGGITGCGIARDAAMRGWKVALIEKDDFASGTSSRSSRLVHGGLRYLEHGHLGLVFEASRERRTLARVAPHLVRPQSFLWPVYEGARVTPWKLRAGLALYDALAAFRNRATRWIAADEIGEREPELRQHGLLSGAVYYDATTDDSRLTIANARAATDLGAIVLNHARVVGLGADDTHTRTVHIGDEETGIQLVAHARMVVNAAGPWSDEVTQLAVPTMVSHTVRPSKGSHILVPRERIGNRGAITIISPIDGRVMFVLPAGPTGTEFTLIGTTETEYEGPPDEVRATTADIEYILRTANALFPAARLGLRDVVSAWAGIRPLVPSTEADAGKVSREHSITQVAPGVIAVRGGKLTTYRDMAAQTVRFAARRMGRRAERAARTDLARLPGGNLLDGAEAEISRASAALDDPYVAEHLVRAYGSEWRDVWALAEPDACLREPVVEGLPYRMAEVRWAVEREMARSLGDVLIRRMHVAFEAEDHGAAAAERVAGVMAETLEWTPERRSAELEQWFSERAAIFGVDDVVLA
ncbi:MAG TPA: glycerol-3-phosphate dehydrogenase [Gemmatimonadaceae bacterium]|nr:glycerol-3-phosphate dehydrogenase [Gemmatimonadaceae bacterium]